MSEHDLNDPKLIQAGEAVARLPQENPPRDLVARALARIAEGYKPVKRVFWMLRPITHPMARVAAAAVIILIMLPMTDLNLADPLGAGIENRILGRGTTDRVEHFVDTLLIRHGPATYSEPDPHAFMGVQQPCDTRIRRGAGGTNARRV